ncbi:MAG TPA: orotidine-5'-phosphate decarboxylase [Acidimicrobiia bacterium]|nr:orotidine-5'-phosphate decarboxylase [Acidimicrobiia bacterium]
MTDSPRNPIIVALDVAEARLAVELAKRLQGHVGGFKIGLELLMGPGPATIAAVRELGLPVFVDAKLHDIPRTANRAARALGSVGARWVTAHAVGGRDMLVAAVEGLAEGAGGHDAGILAITVLTSLTPADLAATGVNGSPGRQVARLARLAAGAHVEGVVCSVAELGDVHQVAPQLTRVTPGIRLAGGEHHDQVRVDTPQAAVARGADWMVVGRPITRSENPVAAAAAYREALAEAKTAGGSRLSGSGA